MENDKDKPEGDSVLTTTAKTIGKVAGKITAVVGAARTKSATAEKRSKARLRRPKVHKLAKKNKIRIPRKMKKAQKKATAKTPVQ